MLVSMIALGIIAYILTVDYGLPLFGTFFLYVVEGIINLLVWGAGKALAAACAAVAASGAAIYSVRYGCRRLLLGAANALGGDDDAEVPPGTPPHPAGGYQPAASPPGTGVTVLRARVLNFQQQLDALRECTICYERRVDAAIQPCGHQYCSTCIQTIQNGPANTRNCPLGCGRVRGVAKVFVPL